jgi:hypothetical protein
MGSYGFEWRPKVMMFGAIASTAGFFFAISGQPVKPWMIGFAGFSCGFCWALIYARYAIERAGL